MGRAVAKRRLQVGIVTALLVVGSAGCTTAAPTPTVAQRPTEAPSPSIGLIPTPTSILTPTTAPTPTATAVPAASRWREVPTQRSVSGVQFQDVTWTGTRFVAIGDAAKGAVFLDSTDGVVWHRQAGSRAGARRLAAGPSGVVAVGRTKRGLASWTSTDGLTWKGPLRGFPAAPDGSSPGESVVDVTDVVASDDGWLAVGRKDPACFFDCGESPIRAFVWTSKDGAHWIRVADQKAFKGGGMNAVSRGDDGFAAAGAASDHAAIWTSPDGLVWSRVPDDPMFSGPKSAGYLPVQATGVATRDGVIVVVGSALGQDACPPGVAEPSCPGARAWWSAHGKTWSKASVEKAKDGQVFGVASTPDGFLATGPAGGRSCLGGIWASTDGRAWRCDASSSRFKGFGPYAAAASDTVEVAVGLRGIPGAVWYRTRP